MYCKHCGRELNDYVVFCPDCGKPIVRVEKYSEEDRQRAEALRDDPKFAKFMKVMLIAAAALQAMTLILRFVPFAEWSLVIGNLNKSYGEVTSINTVMSKLGESVIYTILLLVSIAFCVLPVVKNAPVKRRKMILGKVLAFWNLAVGAFILLMAADTVKSNTERFVYQLGEAAVTSSSSGLTFGGWLSVLVTLATIVVLFVISNKTKLMDKK